MHSSGSPGSRRVAVSQRRWKAGLFLSASACAAIFFGAGGVAGCGGGVWPERDPTTVEGIRVDSVRILPFGSRFVLSDSASRVEFVHVHIGYSCSKILEMELASEPSGFPAAFRPSTRVRLPAAPDCALDSGLSDTTISHVFGADLGFVRVANSEGKATDSARVVRGVMAFDSLTGPLGIAGTVSRGPWTFRDSSALAPRMLFGDSLSSCSYLNQADFRKAGDTLTIRLSYVTLDPSASPDSCRGAVRPDSVPVGLTPVEKKKLP